MNYPFWVVPHIGSAWVIGGIAIFHVMISHFAVGGGFYLVLTERKALALKSVEWMAILRAHSRFFLILTGVFGAASGVGIWFSIGLAHPEATSTLIHNFVFGWAIEWVFFIVELSAAAVYYYSWDRIPEALHLKVGWLYAATSLCTLIIINGILTFMLTPGKTWLSVAGSGHESQYFWQAFFNPTYWPSLFLRTAACCSLAGVWALVTCARFDGDTHPIKGDLVLWSVKWLIPSFVAMPLLLVWYLSDVPESQKALLSFGLHTIGTGAFTQVTRTVLVTIMTSATIIAVVYLFAAKSPRDFSFGAALAVLALALMTTGSTEYAREMLRKPFVIGGHMYSNGVRVSAVSRFNQLGYLTHSSWVSPLGDPWLAQGEAMFRGQCMSCHTPDGYRSMTRLLQGRDRQSIGNLLAILQQHAPDSPYRAFMPPLVGTTSEINALGDYLHGLSQPQIPLLVTATKPNIALTDAKGARSIEH
jgi:cytochrome d ubiquinol oxidase subunit I